MDRIDPEPASPATAPGAQHVLVTYEASAAGRAAPSHALASRAPRTHH
jgi:hypothetical protein